MARITAMMHAGKCRIAVLESDHGVDRPSSMIVGGVTFDVSPGTANVGGMRKPLNDSLRIDADPDSYPDAFFLGKEAFVL